MADLSLGLLGTYQVRRGALPITQFHSNYVRSLLAYLAVEADRAHERTLLAGLLWPDQPSEAALTNLRQTLHRLGQALGDGQARPAGAGAPAPALILATRQAVQINPAVLIETDVQQLTSLLAGVKAHPHRRLSACRVCLHQLRAAVALYRGEFLAGFVPEGGIGFEAWLLRWRERLREQAVWALATLAEHYRQRGDHERAVDYGQRCLELEPWREEMHQLVMQALALGGQRSAALAQYERCQAALLAELNAAPLPETSALAAVIRAGRAIAFAEPAMDVPRAPTPCLGRETELRSIAGYLARDDCHLVTLVGSGGIGKTRLALEAARAEHGAFVDGIVFVALAAVPSASHLAAALINQFGLTMDAAAQTAPRTVLHKYLRRRELLLVLDNFEHLLDGAELLAELLEAAPGLHVLVTSREPLRLHAEWLLRLGGLALPVPLADDDHDLSEATRPMGQPADSPAVQLFFHVAQRADPTFTPDAELAQVAAQICTLLGGLPLAIHLAAGLLPRASAAAVLAMLTHDLATLQTTRRDEFERHRSLSALFLSAWRLLAPDEQQVLAHCAVFRADFSAAAALAVANGAVSTPVTPEHRARLTAILDGLADKSLLERSVTGRYALHAVVQQFAAAQLAAWSPDAEVQARTRHSQFFLTMLTGYADALVSPQAQPIIALLRAELVEVRASWSWAVTRGESAALVAATPAIRDLTRMIGEAPTGVLALAAATTALQQADARDPASHMQQIHLLLAQAELHYTCSNYPELIALAETAHTLACSLRQPGLEAQALLVMGKAHWRQGNAARAAALLRQAYTRIQADITQSARTGQRVRNQIHYYQGLLAWNEGSFAQARRHYQAALQLARAANDGFGEGDALNNLALVAFVQGAFPAAVVASAAALAVYQASGNYAGEGLAQISAGLAHMYQNHDGAAQDAFTASLRIHRRAGDQQNTSVTQILWAMQATRTGNYRAARQMLDQGLASCRALNHQWGLSVGLAYDGLLHHLMGDDTGAEACCREALAITEGTRDFVIAAYALTHLGHCLFAQHQVDQAAAMYQRAYDVRRALGQHHLTPDPLVGLVRCAVQRGNAAAALRHAEAALEIYATHGFAATEEPARIILTCISVLPANTTHALQLAAQVACEIQARAERMPDIEARQQFLNGVAANRMLLAAYG